MGGKAVITHVMDYMARHRNRVVDISSIEKATGLERKQIQAALANARAKGVQIEVLVRGSVYRYVDGGDYTSAPVPAYEDVEDQNLGVEPEEEIEDLFVRIGWTDDNEPILKAATSGEVFKGVPL